MAVMPTPAWEPGDLLTPYHLHSPGQYSDPRHRHPLPRPRALRTNPEIFRTKSSAGFDYDRHGNFERYTYVDLIQDTVVQVSSFETETRPLLETELWFWLDEMAAFDWQCGKTPGLSDVDGKMSRTTVSYV